MAEPNEIIVGPVEVYVAPEGEAFPGVTATPGGNWQLVGKSGSKNYAESGVIIRQPVTQNPIRALGTTAPRKHVISERNFQVELGVMDLTPEAMALGYGADPDGDISHGGNHTRLELPTDPVPLVYAMLLRVQGQSPYKDGGNMQWEISHAIQAGNGEGTFSKTNAFTQGHQWNAFEGPNGDFVALVAEGDTSS